VFMAGTPSHGYGAHEHYAGCKLLADAVTAADENAECVLIQNGWPADDSELDDADVLVIYADGGRGHPAAAKMDRLEELLADGTGLVCLHYGVEVEKGTVGDRFIQLLGGYFETDWSVNPHWVANFEVFPEHPIATDLTPFSADDEWYFNMRFVDGMKNVTPILSAVAPESTMSRPDGPHSGNPDVRKRVARGDRQHVAWAFERDGGGRSFGFTGGHYHWNWAKPEQTTLVRNAILWAANQDVPSSPAESLSVDELAEGQDEVKPSDLSPQEIKRRFNLTTNPINADAKSTLAIPESMKPLVLVSSPIVDSTTANHQVELSADLEGVEKIFLVVTDAGDGFSCDHANWINPRITVHGETKSLTDLGWESATSGWGEPRIGKSANGRELLTQNQNIGNGIGTHANSIIEFVVPEGATKFEAIGALDSGGTNQNGGQTTSVRFVVFADQAPADINEIEQRKAEAQRSPQNAVAGLTAADGLEIQLAASEPTLKSLTNIDVDHRGRVWVCEVVNYRRHNGEREQGDRILILEDTNKDGVMDTSKVFYQGRDIDSAMGICVLGNRVIVSASPNVWSFVDTDGDDVADEKTTLFTNVGVPQHDHTVHSFVFGPDGKLYFNFGNEGHQIHDANGNPLKDRWGNVINDSGKPYRQGMVFRCDVDGSDIEVLGHNFRNNYEVAVDSFGRMWQSDNDDDGNRSTRINYVMEYGNYGYTDEMTGAGWRAERTNLESEIPQQHWHLNDPGVTPTMLITGAGSPTGMTIYEGRLLPEIFHDQILHCDAGPNIVRSYPIERDGAGFTASIENLVEGERDKWFRPADVCVAPDGSVFISDWYDPGVGGHQMGDTQRGRLFRVAPPKSTYEIPSYDFNDLDDSLAAFQSPNLATRYLAWQSLISFGQTALPSIVKLTDDANPRVRARAYWLISKLAAPESGEPASNSWLSKALQDIDLSVRCAAVRMARENHIAVADYITTDLIASTPAMQRELLIAVRESNDQDAIEIWADIVAQYDGTDRWLLEAIGIAADGRWPECLEALKNKGFESLSDDVQRDIVWRSRGQNSADQIAELLKDESLPAPEVDRLLRSLDFQNAVQREHALRSLLELVTTPE
jgi:putative membrane-bound dehydrogenase-like protein